MAAISRPELRSRYAPLEAAKWCRNHAAKEIDKILIAGLLTPVGSALQAEEALLPLSAAPIVGERIESASGAAAEVFSFDDRLASSLIATPVERDLTLEALPVAPGVRADVIVARHEIYAPDAKIFAIGKGGTTEVPRSRWIFFWGVSAEDLLAAPVSRPPVPTFAEYIPTVSAAVTDGTRRVYGSYWNRIAEQWGHRHLDEPTPSEIKQLVEYVKVNVVARRNARGGRSAGEHLIAALRCLYRHAEDDKLIDQQRRVASGAIRIC